MLAKIRHPKAGEISQIGIPMKFSDTPAEIREPPPLLGQQTEEILTTVLRLDLRRIAELNEKHVI